MCKLTMKCVNTETAATDWGRQLPTHNDKTSFKTGKACPVWHRKRAYFFVNSNVSLLDLHNSSTKGIQWFQTVYSGKKYQPSTKGWTDSENVQVPADSCSTSTVQRYRDQNSDLWSTKCFNMCRAKIRMFFPQTNCVLSWWPWKTHQHLIPKSIPWTSKKIFYKRLTEGYLSYNETRCA